MTEHYVLKSYHSSCIWDGVELERVEAGTPMLWYWQLDDRVMKWLNSVTETGSMIHPTEEISSRKNG